MIEITFHEDLGLIMKWRRNAHNIYDLKRYTGTVGWHYIKKHLEKKDMSNV